MKTTSRLCLVSRAHLASSAAARDCRVTPVTVSRVTTARCDPSPQRTLVTYIETNVL